MCHWWQATRATRSTLFVALVAFQGNSALEVVRSCTSSEVPWPSGRCEDFDAAKQKALEFLKANMPPWDEINRGTLELGILPGTVRQALKVRQDFAWAAQVPEDVWRDYVLPYASVNEARSDWRPLLYQKLNMANDASKSLGDVAMWVNQNLWSALNATKPIYFKAQQTPMIYDSMSAISFGYASCTWEVQLGRVQVEIWLGEGKGLENEPWVIMESQPAGPGETLLNPCDKWPSPVRAPAVELRVMLVVMVYPMSWDLANKNIPGVNRSSFYNVVCGRC
eukprot:Skav201885  [mRNA]  locus=scaffold550:350235:355845:- [translate_table: standard]